MIDTVNRAILRNLRSAHTGKGRIEVYNVNDLVTDSARWDLTRPSNNSFEAMHVYGSYDPAKSADIKLRNWFTNILDRMPGVHAVLRERQKKRNYPKCPSCQWEIRKMRELR